MRYAETATSPTSADTRPWRPQPGNGFDQLVCSQDERHGSECHFAPIIGVTQRVHSEGSNHESRNQVGFGRITHNITPFAHSHRATTVFG